MNTPCRLAFAGLVLLASACPSAKGEDDAYDLVKTKAKQDLTCDDVTVRKMAQDGASYEYQATGCDDIYSYGVECGAQCEIVAGVRGPGLGGLWNQATGFIDGIAKDLKEADARQRATEARHDAMREKMNANLGEHEKRLFGP